MKPQNQKLNEFLSLINNYPSPHNGQPMMLREAGENMYEILFDTSRGLTSTAISYLFSFVTVGVFVRHLELCAEALGHSVRIELQLPEQGRMAGSDPLHCATFTVEYDVTEPVPELLAAIRNRQTSRKKYSSGLDDEEKQHITETASRHGIANNFVSVEQAHQVIWLNQRAVFDDMFNPAVRTELDHWLRYSAEEKHAKRDGLSYDCMELSGRALKYIVKHYKLLRWPVIAPLLKRYYLRTMKDESTVGYFTSPFETELQSYEIGRCMIEIWLDMTKQGKYLHPFGTIVSNDEAHRDFTEVVGLTDENRATKHVVFIYRAGASARPVESERIPVGAHLYMEENK